MLNQRHVQVTWVPGTDIWGRPIMEMRWLVEDTPVPTEA